MPPPDIALGFVIGKCYKRNRAVEFLSFLKEIDAQVPEGLAIHIIMDNYQGVARASPALSRALTPNFGLLD